MTNEHRRAGNQVCPLILSFNLLSNWVRELLYTVVEGLPLSVYGGTSKRSTVTCIFQAMDRLLLAGLQILCVLSFTAHASSSRPHIIFILADDLVSMILISFYLYVREGIRVYAFLVD